MQTCTRMAELLDLLLKIFSLKTSEQEDSTAHKQFMVGGSTCDSFSEVNQYYGSPAKGIKVRG